MCTYCGCEAEPVMKALMEDHAEVAALIREINHSVEEGGSQRAATATAQLAELFGRHSEAEEAGIFHQLVLAGEATRQIEQLLEAHRRLRSGLGDPDITLQPARLRELLLELRHHAEIEDTDLFPFALQALPSQSWHLIGRMST